jgi:sodium/hydrogen exchanger-like protein 6/7
VPSRRLTRSLPGSSVLLVLLLLILSFWVSYYLKVRRIKSVHETLVALLAGAFVGLVVRLSPGTVVQNMISFSGYSSPAA